MNKLGKKLRALWHRRQLDRDLNDELRFHLDMSAEERRDEQGARRFFGNITAYKETCRDLWAFTSIETWWQDIRYALRGMARTPVFTGIAISTLALGIGANTTIFSAMNAFVLRPLQVAKPEKLVYISEEKLNGRGSRLPTVASYLEWKRSNMAFEDIARGDFGGEPVMLSGYGSAERIKVAYCTSNYLSMLGVRFFRGRLFLAEDVLKAESSAVVISAELWQRTFNGQRDALGKTIRLGGLPSTIVGILPPGFSITRWNMDVDVWVPANLIPSVFQSRWMPVTGRLKPGVTAKQAEQDLKNIWASMDSQANDKHEWTIRLTDLHKYLIGNAPQYFSLLLGAAGFILLIACANVANMLLARSTARAKEIAIRASLGAGRYRLIRQLLVESILLSLGGGVAGVLIAFWGIRILVAATPGFMGQVPVELDRRVLEFTVALSLGTGIFFGLFPAVRGTQSSLRDSLNQVGSHSSGVFRQYRQSLLLITELALAMVLCIGAGLMIRSFISLHKTKLGFAPRNVLRANLFLDGPKYEHNAPNDTKTVNTRGDAFFRELLARTSALPGVEAASICHWAPPGDVEWRSIHILGRPEHPANDQLQSGVNEVSAGYFRTLRIPLLKGRYLTDRDTEGTPWVAVINESFAKRYFPNQDPLGKLIQTTVGDSTSSLVLKESRSRQIAGVIGDVRQFGFGSDHEPILYSSYRQHDATYPGGFYYYHLAKSVIVRTRTDPTAIVTPLRKIVSELDADQALFDVGTVEHALGESVSFNKFQMNLFAVFGGLALALAAVGIYGVMSYVVAQRTHEIGIRMALSAERSGVLRMILVHGLKAGAIGSCLGLAISFALMHLLAHFLYGVEPTDPATYAIVIALLAVVAVLASCGPAIRATHVDPVIALRND